VSFTASPNAVSRVQLDQTTNGWYFDLSTWDDADVQRDKPTGVNMAQEAIGRFSSRIFVRQNLPNRHTQLTSIHQWHLLEKGWHQ